MENHVEVLREGGPYEIEVICELGGEAIFEVASCAVVYGDRGQPTHSVRVFKFKEQ